MIPPSLISSGQTSWTSLATPKTLSVTVQIGDLIVVGALAEGPYTTLGISGGSLTWTQQQSVAVAGRADAVLWTAIAATSATFSIAVANTGSTDPYDGMYGFSATVWRNHGGVGATVQTHGDGTAAVLYAPQSDNSAAVTFVSDYAAGNGASRSWVTINGATATELAYGYQSGRYTWYGAYYADTNAAGTYSMGLSSPGMAYSLVGLEIKGTTTGITASNNYPASTVSTEAFGSPTITMGTATSIPAGIASTAAFGVPTARLDTWRQIIEGDSWRNAVTAHQRTIGYRAEMIDASGNHVLDLPLTSGSVDFDGEAAEQWACQITIPGAEWVPKAPTDALDPRSGLRCRLWWRLLINGGWVETPLGTYVLEDPRISDNGAMPTTSVRGRDPLTIIRRAGYGSLVVSVGGLTVPAALSRIMQAIAPKTPFRIDSTSAVTLPATYELTGSDPLDDLTTIASQARLVIRTDPEGRVIATRNPESQTLRADWQEGPDCPVTDLSKGVNTSQMLNSVTVVSTSPEVIPPISATVEDDDPSSPTWIGGIWGRRALTIRTDSIATTEGATSMARGILNGRRRPQEEISIEVPPRGDLQYRDKVALARAMSAVGDTYRIASWNLQFGSAKEAPKTMAVKMISRTLI